MSVTPEEIIDGRRVVHLCMTEHPTNVELSYMGHAIGQIEGNVLRKIRTALEGSGLEPMAA